MLSQLAERGNGRGAGLEEAEAVGAASDSVSSSPAPPRTRLKWTRERVIEVIREVGEKIGRAPTQSDMKRAGYASAVVTSTTLKRLGASLEELAIEAGFAPATTAAPGEELGRAEALAPTSPQGNTAARPAKSEREPQAEDAADAGSALERTVSQPPAATAEAASSSEIGPLDLVRLIEELDTGIVTVTRWRNGDGYEDEATERRIRQIMRDSLGGYAAFEIGEAVLDHIDRETAMCRACKYESMRGVPRLDAGRPQPESHPWRAAETARLAA
jgi:hypothetical protein